MMRLLSIVLAAGAVTVLALPSFAQGTAPGTVVRFTGQLLDVRNGYVYFTTGDAFKLAPAPKLADYDTGGPTSLQPRAKIFARAILDPATKQVVELDLTKRRLPPDVAYAQVLQYSATGPTTVRAPEIVGQNITGREVAVEFVVTVPPTTPLSADVYISTDYSNWDPRAIKMDRIDGQRYRAVRRLASGTKFAFRVTRGSWNSTELGQNGLQPTPHPYFTKEVDAQSVPVTVYAWSDDRANAPQAAQPGAIPTPFNPNPFPPGGIYPPSRATPPGGFPTPRPGQPNKPPR
jgi:hypothetical protein